MHTQLLHSEKIMGNIFEEEWVYKLGFYISVFLALIIPGYYLIKFFKSKNYNLKPRSFFNSLVVKCVYGGYDEEEGEESSSEQEILNKTPIIPGQDDESSKSKTYLKLLVCTLGIWISLLGWALLQEQLVKKPYLIEGGDEVRQDYEKLNASIQIYNISTNQFEVKFRNTLFMVFGNKTASLVLAIIYLLVTTQKPSTLPLYKVSFCSMSNIISSWSGYDALKYVAFPVVVMIKASKIVPVMLMSLVILYVFGMKERKGSKISQKYSKTDWLNAVILSVGVSIFLIASKEDKGKNTGHSLFSGMILMMVYIVADAFTSNWQSHLFQKYKASSVQMMFGMNLFSSSLTFATLIFDGTLSSSFAFFLMNKTFMYHLTILAACSSIGQLFIFYTIKEFGAIVFIVIMAFRQMISVYLSCLVHGTKLTSFALVGVAIVFFAVFLKIFIKYRDQKKKKEKKKAENQEKV